jgi:hypothetical protein
VQLSLPWLGRHGLPAHTVIHLPECL